MENTKQFGCILCHRNYFDYAFELDKYGIPQLLMWCDECHRQRIALKAESKKKPRRRACHATG